MNLSDQHAVVTGGATGIGLAITRDLCAAGAKVTIMGRNLQRLEQVATTDELINAVQVDVSDQESVTAAFVKARNYGPVSILVNNAGIAETAAFAKTSFEQWQKLLSVNLSGIFLTTQAAMVDIKAAKNGRIINIASTAGLKGYAYTTAYTAAKHGVIGLTRSLALELSHTKVTVNAICPGFTNTAIVDNAVKNIHDITARSEQDALEELISNNPQNRLIEPEEIAETVLWLCNPKSRSITGQSIVIAGGELM